MQFCLGMLRVKQCPVVFPLKFASFSWYYAILCQKKHTRSFLAACLFVHRLFDESEEQPSEKTSE